MGYNGLKTNTPGLPAGHYFDPALYALDLKKIWRRQWIYVCRSADIQAARSFITHEIGDQRILLVRTETGGLNGFYNTCRHRGALLCTEPAGVLRSAAIVCPYHAWAYGLDGRLLRTSSKAHAAGFEPGDYPLYEIAVTEWNGFIFVALGTDPPAFADGFDQPLNRMDGWRLQDLRAAHTFKKIMQCNWKIFWENYNECLHCPSVHPELSQLVPIFGRGLLEERDDPRWPEHAGDIDPRFKGGLRAGAATWSKDGQLVGEAIAGLKEEDRKAAHVYMTSLPSVFIVGHPDYVRVVRLRPLAPEQTEMRVEYLFAPGTLDDQAVDLRNAVDFANTVMSEDAAVCELNQKGLHAAPHRRGVLMPEEYLVSQFHEWLRRELARD
jgi:Rieske 2Fe-2S family protein